MIMRSLCLGCLATGILLVVSSPADAQLDLYPPTPGSPVPDAIVTRISMDSTGNILEFAGTYTTDPPVVQLKYLTPNPDWVFNYDIVGGNFAAPDVIVNTTDKTWTVSHNRGAYWPTGSYVISAFEGGDTHAVNFLIQSGGSPSSSAGTYLVGVGF